MFQAFVAPSGRILRVSSASQRQPAGDGERAVDLSAADYDRVIGAIHGPGPGHWIDGETVQAQTEFPVEVPATALAPGVVSITWTGSLEFRVNGIPGVSDAGVRIHLLRPGIYHFEVDDPRYVPRRYVIEGVSA